MRLPIKKISKIWLRSGGRRLEGWPSPEGLVEGPTADELQQSPSSVFLLTADEATHTTTSTYYQ